MLHRPVLRTTSPLSSHAVGCSYVIVVCSAPCAGVVFVRLAEAGRNWELPGGRIEANETPEAAAEREFLEETGLVLGCPEIAAVIENTSADGCEITSLAYLVVGAVSDFSEHPMPVGSETLERALMSAPPRDGSFDHVWINRLVTLGLESKKRGRNKEMWQAAAEDYSSAVTISESEVHYGPLIPGERELRLLPPLQGASVLDLGCGAGHNLAAMARMGAGSGLGVDFANHHVSLARQRVPRGFLIEYDDICSVDLSEEGPFDVVLSVFAIAFISDIRSVMSRIAAAMSPGGVLILATDHAYRAGQWVDGKAEIGDWHSTGGHPRTWFTNDDRTYVFYHTLHSIPSLVDAVVGAGLVIDTMLEPKALPLKEMHRAPYVSDYYRSKHQQMTESPYTLIVKARKPDGC